ncbi:DUF2914 domain-containing protein [Allohahella sp. A8]|uniref:DUF2914 domain-containing protein n=1 Tax=Allohahella sp. A8 TaxID=3141461 RepID=UPI003A7F9D37
MPKRLRLSVNNPQISSERPLSPSVYVTQYHWPRIIGAGVVLLGLIAALYFWAASGDDDEAGLASDGDIEIASPAPSEATEAPVFVEPVDPVATSESVQEPAQAAAGQAAGGSAQRVPVPRDATRENAFGSGRPLAESLSDQVHQKQQPAATASVLAPESEAERSKYRLTVQDEPVRQPGAVPSPQQGPAPAGIMTVQSNKVARAVITDEVSYSEPAELLSDPVKVAKGRQTTIHLFAEVEDMEGETLRLLWFQGGREVQSLPITVHTSKAVVTSSVAIASSQAGAWQVEIRDKAGKPLASGHFQVKIQ